MSHYKPYPAYKDSGVEWLGQVPEHWEKIPLKWLFDCLDGKRVPLNAEQRSDIKGEIPYWGSGGIVDYICKYIFDESLILLGEDGAPFFDKNRPVSYEISGKSWINNHIHVLRLIRDLPQAWFVNYLNSVEYRLYIDGSTRDKLTQEDMKDIVLLVPPKEEIYFAISHLDRETFRIDALVAKKTRFIELLREKRQALITHAVTKGLDPKVKMKDSGVEWLGEVPEHWIVLSFQRCVHIAQGQVNPEESPYSDMMLIAPNHVESGTGRLLYTETAAEQMAESGKYLCCEGDVIYSKIRPALRKACLAPVNCLCSADMYPLSGDKSLSNQYLLWFLLSEPFSAFAVLEADRVAMPKINRESLNALKLALPPISEQKIISNMLTQATTRIDAVVEKTERSIELLNERRSALITAAVTGQIDLREAA